MSRMDEIRKVFDHNAVAYLNKFSDQSKFLKPLQGFANQLRSPDPAILDVGCGPGNLTKLIKELIPNSKITGIDFAATMIDLARQTVPDAHFQVYDIRKLEALNLPLFDGVVCSFCIPYLSPIEAKALLDDLTKRTAPNGMIYLSAMEWSPEHSGFIKPSNNQGRGIFTHYYERSFLENLLVKCGFNMRSIVTIDQDYYDDEGPKDLVMVAQLST